MKALLIVTLLFSLQVQASHQVGDLVFLGMPCFICPLIEKTTKSPYSHVGFLNVDKNGQWVVTMAVDPKVLEVPLDFLLSKVKSPPAYMRFPNQQGQLWAKQAALEARKFLGAPYDPKFVLGENALYCSELIYFSFLRASGGKASPFPLVPMDFNPYFKDWEKVLRQPPPQGKPGLSPGDIARSKLLQVVGRDLAQRQRSL